MIDGAPSLPAKRAADAEFWRRHEQKNPFHAGVKREIADAFRRLLTGAQFAVLDTLLELIHRTKTVLVAEHDRIAECSGKHPDTVIEAIKVLEEKCSVGVRRFGGRGLANQYDLEPTKLLARKINQVRKEKTRGANAPTPNAPRESARIEATATRAGARVFVWKDSKAWDAWVEYRKRQGIVPPSMPTTRRGGYDGWFMPTLFPPDVAGGAKTAGNLAGQTVGKIAERVGTAPEKPPADPTPSLISLDNNPFGARARASRAWEGFKRHLGRLSGDEVLVASLFAEASLTEHAPHVVTIDVRSDSVATQIIQTFGAQLLQAWRFERAALQAVHISVLGRKIPFEGPRNSI